jgi:hypothetical protein
MDSGSSVPQALKALAVADSGFVFDPRTGHSYSLNGSGLVALRALQAGRAPSEIAASLRAEFEGAGHAEEDIESFVATLSDLGLLPARAVRSGETR